MSDKKIVEVVRVLQDICITDTSVDNIGAAFEIFFNYDQQISFERVYQSELAEGKTEEEAILAALSANSYKVFMAEANYVGYSSTGVLMEKNDLYRGSAGGHLSDDQTGTILGEYRRFCADSDNYIPTVNDCA